MTEPTDQKFVDHPAPSIGLITLVISLICVLMGAFILVVQHENWMALDHPLRPPVKRPASPQEEQDMGLVPDAQQPRSICAEDRSVRPRSDQRDDQIISRT